MIWTMMVFALTLFRPAPPAASVVDVSGSWQVMGEIQGDINSGTFEATCTFNQKDEKIDGVCKRASGDSNVTGLVTERGVGFQYDIDNGGATRTFVFNGTLDKAGTTIKGDVSLSGVGEGMFTATKQKK